MDASWGQPRYLQWIRTQARFFNRTLQIHRHLLSRRRLVDQLSPLTCNWSHSFIYNKRWAQWLHQTSFCCSWLFHRSTILHQIKDKKCMWHYCLDPLFNEFYWVRRSILRRIFPWQIHDFFSWLNCWRNCQDPYWERRSWSNP